MKVLAFGGFFVAAGAAVYFFAGAPRPANVYDMTTDEAYAKLAVEQFDESYVNNQPIGGIVKGNGHNEVNWSNGSHNYCDIVLGTDPQWSGDTRVDVSCNGGGTGKTGIAGITHNLMRNEVIERVDALLTERPFDRQRATGSTAARWPSDGATGGYGAMVGDAMKMEADIRKDMHRVSKKLEERESKAAFGHEASPSSFGKPGVQ